MIFKRLLKHLSPYKKGIILVIITVAISSIFSIFSPKLVGDFINSIYESVKTDTNINFKTLYYLLGLLSFIYIFNAFSSYLENYIMSNICQNALNKLKNEANHKLSRLSTKYYDTHQKGELLSRINNDIETVSSLFLQIIPKIISYLITFIGILIIMTTINVTLTLITLISIPLSIFFNKVILKLSKKKYMEYYQKLGNINSLINECYQNQETISLYNNDISMSQSFNLLNKDLAKTNKKMTFISLLINPIVSLINYSIYIIIIFLGSKSVLENKMKLGDIQSLIQYTKQLANPINSASSLLSQIQASLVAAKRVFELLDEQEEKDYGTLKLDSINTIEFKNVDFSYNDCPFIENFNLKINKGDKIAIIGETGSGKTTVTNLLMNFYKINKGNILINNKSIYDYNLKDYYSHISLITQHLWISSDTLENNIKYGNDEINNEKIQTIFQETNCLNIINNIKKNQEEIINENKLSEGEKQIITITRALIKEHDLLILDEATSNIDSKTEKLIQDSINKIDRDKTTITIAHRLSTILNADKIIVMKNGKIIEQGSPSTLYKQKGEYYKYLQTL